jgi:hypothetical protein
MNLSALDECAALIREAAEPLPRDRRHRFYERVSELLKNDEVLIPAAVRAACARAQVEFLNAPLVDAAD